MASASSWAQHFLECDNCERRPAQYLCKPCKGHLCEDCKKEHNQKRLTKDHETVLLSADHSTKIQFPYCPDHKENIVECYCSPCDIPVCTKCLTGIHNEHSVKDLMTVYDEIRDELLRYRQETESTLLPACQKQLSKYDTNKSKVSERANEVEHQIEAHAEAIIKRVLNTKEKAIASLRDSERKALKRIDGSQKDVKNKIGSLNLLQRKISEKLRFNPEFEFFKNEEIRQLKDDTPFRNYSYKIANFAPGPLEKIYIEKEFGETSSFRNPTFFSAAVDHMTRILKL